MPQAFRKGLRSLALCFGNKSIHVFCQIWVGPSPGGHAWPAKALVWTSQSCRHLRNSRAPLLELATLRPHATVSTLSSLAPLPLFEFLCLPDPSLPAPLHENHRSYLSRLLYSSLTVITGTARPPGSQLDGLGSRCLHSLLFSFITN